MSDRFHVGSRKGLFTYTKTGEGWSHGDPAFLGEPVSSVLHDRRDRTIYAALDLGHFGPKLHRSDNHGQSWTELSAPGFARTDEEDPDAPSVSLIWTLVPGGTDQPGVLWAGTIPGGLFRSDDRGESWTLIQSLWDRPEREKWFGGGFDKPGIHSILVDPRDSAKLTIGISCGGIWKSDDAGASWRQAGMGLRAAFLPPDQQYDQVNQDPHRLSACASDPDTVWCQHHNGVFLSKDGAETFSELSETFGFGVAAHPKDPSTAFFAPGVKDECRVPIDARFVIHRRTGDGKTVDSLSDGLPDGPAYDLVYRHALAIDETGGRLVAGSTTGNLWISEDGGEHWSQLSAHLPPIVHVSWA